MSPLLLLLTALGAINFGSVLLYALTSFGNAILFHIGYRVCSLASSGSVCEPDNIPLVVVYITLSGLALFPGQLWRLRTSINWPLAINLAIAQQIGLVVGVYVLFSYRSVVISRVIGALFFVAALQSLAGRKKGPASPAPAPTVNTGNSGEELVSADYEPYRLVGKPERIALLYLVGVSSGVFGGMLGTGGPPLIWFAAHAKLNSRETRATFAFGFLLETVSRLVYMFGVQTSVAGLSSLTNLLVFCVLSLTSLVSLSLGNWVASKAVSERGFENMLIGLMAGGAVLIGVDGLGPRASAIVTVTAGLIFAVAALVIHRHRGGSAEDATNASVSASAASRSPSPPSPLRSSSVLVLTVSDARGGGIGGGGGTWRSRGMRQGASAYSPLGGLDALNELNFELPGEDGLAMDRTSSKALPPPSSAAPQVRASSLFSRFQALKGPAPPAVYSVLPQSRYVETDDDVMF